MPENVQPEKCIYEYAAKVVCGVIPEEPVAPPMPPCGPGYYTTATNIHNPGPGLAPLWVKFAHAPQAVDYANPHIGGQVSAWFKYELKPDQAMELDCDFLLFAAKASGMNLGNFAKGFVVIQSQGRLDVVSVYTAGPLLKGPTANKLMGYVATMHTERVPEHKIA